MFREPRARRLPGTSPVVGVLRASDVLGERAGEPLEMARRIEKPTGTRHTGVVPGRADAGRGGDGAAAQALVKTVDETGRATRARREKGEKRPPEH